MNTQINDKLETIRKHNELVRAFQQCDLRIYKVISYGMTQIIDLSDVRPEDYPPVIKSLAERGIHFHDNLIAIIPRNKISNVVGQSRNFPKRLDNLLQTQNIIASTTIILQNDKEIIQSSLVNFIYLSEDYLCIEYNSHFRDYLRNFAGHFTEYSTALLKDVSNATAFRLYEILYSNFCQDKWADDKRHAHRSSYTYIYNVTELRYLLSFSSAVGYPALLKELSKTQPNFDYVRELEAKYKTVTPAQIRHFKERDLKDAVKIINDWDSSQIKVSYKENDTGGLGGEIISYIFTVCENVKNNKPVETKRNATALMEKIRKHIPDREKNKVLGIGDKTLYKALANQYTVDEILHAYMLLQNKSDKEKIVSPDAYFETVLENSVQDE